MSLPCTCLCSCTEECEIQRSPLVPLRNSTNEFNNGIWSPLFSGHLAMEPNKRKEDAPMNEFF